MGAAKHEMMRYQEEKWASIDSQNVCKECFNDDGIKKFISENSNLVGCEFCEDSNAAKRKSIDINDVIEFIAERIRLEYSDPQGILPWDSEERCYFGDSVIMSTEELIYDLVESNNQDVIDVVYSAFDDSADWVHEHALRDSPRTTMMSLWGKFSDTVKHEKRFFFSRPSKVNAKRIIIDGAEKPGDILTAISHVSKQIGIIHTVKKGSLVYRARKYFSRENLVVNLHNFGVPSKEISMKFANRMSPAGIPIFYGSDSTKTAFEEVSHSKGDTATAVKFSLNRDLQLFDLTQIPLPPSLFQESDWHLRESIFFLNQFRNELMKPIGRDGHEHVEYIPSQIFTEFIRHRVKYKRQGIDGIIFPSAKRKDGKNYALFCQNDLIVESPARDSKCFLKFEGRV